MPLVIASVLAFILYCVLDVALTPAPDTRSLPKPAWLIVVIFLPVLGSIAWLLGGRPEHAGRSPGGARGPGQRGPRSAGGGPGPRGKGSGGSSWNRPPSGPRTPPKGPDDDPEFLRHVEEQLRRGDQDGPTEDR